MKFRILFHYISYLQYPLVLVALYFALEPYMNVFEAKEELLNSIFRNLNTVLIFMGLAISFSTLQDTTKTQNKISKNVWESPTKGKLFLLFIGVVTFILLVTGLLGYFSTSDGMLKELSFGILVLGIGFVGLLKAAIEMFENHRMDKKANAKNT